MDGVGNKDEAIVTDIGGGEADKRPGGGHRRYASIFLLPIFNRWHIYQVHLDWPVYRRLCSTCVKRSDLQASHGKLWVQSGKPWLRSGFVPTLHSLDPPEPTFPWRKYINYLFPTRGSNGCLQRPWRLMHHAHQRHSERCLLTTLAVFQQVHTQLEVPWWTRPGPARVELALLALYFACIGRRYIQVLGKTGMRIWNLLNASSTRFWPYLSCKSILHSLLLSILMTAAKGKNAVERLVQSLAHQNANVVRYFSICWYVKPIKISSFHVVTMCVKHNRKTYPIVG